MVIHDEGAAPGGATPSGLTKVLTKLILTYLHIADGDGATVVVDAPAVFLDAIDAVGVADIVVDVHHHG